MQGQLGRAAGRADGGGDQRTVLVSQQAVFAGLSESTFLQQYLDQFFTPEVGAQVNEQTAMLFAAATSPEDAAAAITATAGG